MFRLCCGTVWISDPAVVRCHLRRSHLRRLLQEGHRCIVATGLVHLARDLLGDQLVIAVQRGLVRASFQNLRSAEAQQCADARQQPQRP